MQIKAYYTGKLKLGDAVTQDDTRGGYVLQDAPFRRLLGRVSHIVDEETCLVEVRGLLRFRFTGLLRLGEPVVCGDYGAVRFGVGEAGRGIVWSIDQDAKEVVVLL